MTKDLNELNKSAGPQANAADLELDASGLYCPEPVMLLHNKIRDMAAGQRLRLIATDPSTTRDVPKFCLYLGHELLESSKQDGLYIYLIEKKSSGTD